MKRRAQVSHDILEQHAILQKRRRQKYLEEQKGTEHALLQPWRHCGSVAGTDLVEKRKKTTHEQEMSGKKASEAQRTWWASQFMVPEWMIDVPHDLSQSWMVMPRPEGQRCLVTVSHGNVVVRHSSGAILDVFTAMSLAWAVDCGSQREYVLDCIHQDDMFYIMDILCWGGLALLDCTAEFRMFWKVSNVAPVLHAARSETPRSNDRFVLVQHYDATPEGIRMAYDAKDMSCQRDGMVFLHKLCCYHGGQSPLMLRWKDPTTSRYFIDTDADGIALPEQMIILSYAGDHMLVTGDDTPLPVARLPSSLVHACASTLRPGRLLKFKLLSDRENPIQITKDGQVWLSLEYLGTGNKRRRHADTLSKIMFQHMARYSPLSIDSLCTTRSSMQKTYDVSSEEHGNIAYSIGIQK